MPRRGREQRRTETVSADSSSLSSLTDTSNTPLPLPTLLTDVLFRRNPRRQSRLSRANSASASTASSRNSSHASRAEVNETSQLDIGVGSSQAGPSTSIVAGREGRVACPGRNRRRAYSIRDEIDDGREGSAITSIYSSEGYSEPECPPPKRKRRAVPRGRRGNKQRKLNSSRIVKVEEELQAGPSSSAQIASSEIDVEVIPLPGEDLVKEETVYEVQSSSSPEPPPTVVTAAPGISSSEPLAEYTCPICFCPPKNATITPCGHVCCGECLFTAVRAAVQQAPVVPLREPNVAKCPVCRATINGWDGRGGGVIGLKPRTIISL